MSRSAILVVDDETCYCEIMREILQSYGLQVAVAASAAEAIMLMGNLFPNLILVDLMMPDVDGLTLIRRLRAEPSWADIPVVVASAKTTIEDRMAAFEAGATAFLAKPFSAKELRATLRNYVEIPSTATLAAQV